LLAAVCAVAPAHAQPRNVTLVPDRDSLRVSWDAPASGAASAYYVRWATSSAPTTWLNSAGESGEWQPVQNFFIIGLTNGVSYVVSVGAAVSGTTTFISVAVSGTPADPDTSPPALGAPQATPLAWGTHPSAVSVFLSGAPAEAGYIVRWRRKTPQGEWSYMKNLFFSGPGEHISFFDSGFPAKTRVQVQQAAVSSVGVGAWSPSVEAFSSGPPDAPKGVSLETGANLLRIKWTRPDFDGGVELIERGLANAEYRARWRVQDADAGMAGAQPGAWLNSNAEGGTIIATNRLTVQQSFAITMLAGGSEHEVQIRMLNKDLPPGEIDGAWSAALSATPAAPIGGTAQQRMNAMLTALQIVTNETPPRTLLGASADNPAKATFSAAVRTYAFAVAHQVSSVNITATPGFAGAAVRIDNLSDSAPAAMEGMANNLALIGNDNRIEIAVTSADATTVTTYALMVFRGGNIVKITMEIFPTQEEIALMPAFDPLIATYSAIRPSGVSLIYIWADLGKVPAARIRRALPLSHATSNVDLGGRAINGRDYELAAGANAFEITTFNGAVYTLRIVSPPDVPRGLAALRGDGQLALTWTPNADMSISGYKLRWKVAGARDWASPPGAAGLSLVGVQTAYTLSGLQNGVTYEIQIAALNFAGSSAFSASIRAKPAVKPGAPGGLLVQNGVGWLSLSWTASASDGGDELVYVLRWAEGAGSTAWVNPSGADGFSTNSAAPAYVLRGLKSATVYEVQVAARNVAGRSDFTAATRGMSGGFTLDVNRSGGDVDWRDGVIIARHLAGVRGVALVGNLGGDSLVAANVAAHIAAGARDGVLDVDGSGATTAADGIMLARYFLGVRGDALVDGQSGVTDAAAVVGRKIEALLSQ